jgi:hypothetical protein
MPSKQRQNPAAQVPRTAADVLADGWQDGDDFEISFIMTDPRSQGSGQTRQGRGRRTR